MNRRLIIIGLLGAFFILSGIAMRRVRVSPGTVTPDTAPTQVSQSTQATTASISAILTITSGSVDIQSENTWVAASDGHRLIEGDSVKTGPDAQATLVFTDIGELRLEQNTEITLSTLTPFTVLVYQTIGDTYSKVKKILDPASSYEVETPTAVASVRGTAFGVLVDASKESRVVVSENVVTVAPVIREGAMKRRLPAASVSENQGTIINQAVITEVATSNEAPPVTEKTRVLPKEKSNWIEDNRKKDREFERKDQEKLLKAIEEVSSNSAQPIQELNNCVGETCTAFCRLPENSIRCERVKQEKRKERDDRFFPVMTGSPSLAPTDNSIRQMIKPIRDAIERFISPPPEPPKSSDLTAPETPTSLRDSNRRDDRQKKEKELELEQLKITPTPFPEVPTKPLEVPPVLVPLSPFLKP